MSMFRPTGRRLHVFFGTGPQYRHPPWQQVHASPVKAAPIPSPTPFVPDVPTFLKLIGRNASQYADKFPTWESFFSLTTDQLRTLGIEPPSMRKYLLRWRDRFRQGQFGVGGDLTEVVDGVAELRIVEVPTLMDADPSHQNSADSIATATRSPGKTKIIVNVKPGEIHSSMPPQQLKPVEAMRILNGHRITGPYALLTRGSRGEVARIVVTEGMWEHREGRKKPGRKWGQRKEAGRRRKNVNTEKDSAS